MYSVVSSLIEGPADNRSKSPHQLRFYYLQSGELAPISGTLLEYRGKTVDEKDVFSSIDASLRTKYRL